MSNAATRQVPKNAMRFSAGPCQFAAANGDGKVPVRLTARSGDPINHWYFGLCIHDLAGMQLHKDRLPLDYAHYDQEVIGFADKFDVASGDLVVDGQLVPFDEKDRASEIIFKANQGVPYESSIFFDDATVEDIPAGKVAQVNGRQIPGPLTVFRQWGLRGIAICPYGADKNTPVQLAAGEEATITILSTKEENAMAAKKKAASGGDSAAGALTDEAAPAAVEEKPAETKPAESEPAKPAEEAAAVPAAEEKPAEVAPAAATEQAAVQPAAKTGKDFLEAFGQQGAAWFVEGKTWDEAQKLNADALKAENEDLKAKLAAVKFGVKEPLSFTPADDDPNAVESARLKRELGENLGAFAAGIDKGSKRKRDRV
jgi:hypothetical protein